MTVPDTILLIILKMFLMILTIIHNNSCAMVTPLVVVVLEVGVRKGVGALVKVNPMLLVLKPKVAPLTLTLILFLF